MASKVTFVKCTKCNGQGWLASRVRCPECDGMGQVPVTKAPSFFGRLFGSK